MTLSNQASKSRRGWSLIELLIVVAIIGVLVQMMLPAVEMSRESARATVCQNNLRQLATAFLLHHDANKRFPSGGWGYRWAPDPDRGTGRDQPGGWAYSLLPFYGENALFHLGSGASALEKLAVNARRLAVPIAVHYCPSRRLPRAYRVHPTLSYVRQPLGSDPLEVGARIDYAANGGGNGFTSWLPGPETIEAAKEYRYFDPKNGSGIVFPRSEIGMADILDGTSKTYLVGEKYLDPAHYKDGVSFGDDQGPYVADDRDSVRFAGFVDAKPAIDHEGDDRSIGFGSAHPIAFSMAFCDGSVRRIEYDIDGAVHRSQANRADDR